jgi:nucleoside-diphosphate-sugar epimerase
MLSLATWIGDLVGGRSPITFIDRPEDDPRVRRPDITLARTELGWEPQVGIETGLRRTVEWFRDWTREQARDGAAARQAPEPVRLTAGRATVA